MENSTLEDYMIEQDAKSQHSKWMIEIYEAAREKAQARKELRPQKTITKVTEEGIAFISSKMPNRSLKQVMHYVNFIQWKLNRCLRHGESLLEYQEMSKDYKAKWFKGAKGDFVALKDHVFIPYISHKSGKESYRIKGYSKSYRLNPIWLEKYVIFIEGECNSVDKGIDTKVEKYDEMSKSDRKKCAIVDDFLELVKVKVDLTSIPDLYKEAEDEISSYLLKIGPNQYEYSHKTKGLIQIRFNSHEYPVFLRLEKVIQAKYLLYKLTSFEQSKAKAKRNFYEQRLYHKLTNFPKRLYKFLMFNRDRLAEVDISNCFPTLIILSLLGIYDPYSMFRGNSYKEAFRVASWDKGSNIYMLVEETKKGRFYEFITSLIYPKMSEVNKAKKRQFIKRQMSKILFGKYTSTNWIKEKLKEKIPLFIKVIDLQKKLFAINYKRDPSSDIYQHISKQGVKSAFKAGNDTLSILGMITESKLMIDNVYMRLAGEVCLPKHDAVICTKNNVKAVRTRIESTLDKFLGKRNYSLKETVY